jgi:hypothetical protein
MTNDDVCGAIGGVLDKGNRNTRRNLAPVPLCPQHIPNDMTRVRTQAAEVGRQQLTARSTARLYLAKKHMMVEIHATLRH